MRNKFEQELTLLENQLLEMGTLIETAIDMAVKAFSVSDRKAAQAVGAIEERIDKSEHDIELICYRLLLQQQPVARDLRRIAAALKIVTDMERIGDQANDIANIILTADSSISGRYLPHINDMAAVTNLMVRCSVESFVESDIDKAKVVISQDDTVDELFELVREEIIDLIRKDAENGSKALDLLMTAKYFERIGDHAVNIAEWAEYAVTGQLKKA